MSGAAPGVGRFALAANAFTGPSTGKLGFAHHAFSEFATGGEFRGLIGLLRSVVLGAGLCFGVCHEAGAFVSESAPDRYRELVITGVGE